MQNYESDMLQIILRLMHAKSFRGKLRGPEDRLAIDVATMLRVATIEGRLHATFTCVPHEVGAVSPKDPGFHRAQARYAKATAMGLITGSADYVFVWAGGGGWIELKSEDGSLSPAQKDFRAWCAATGCPHAVCRTVAEVEATLKEWGALQA